ncbi:MAG: AsmA family protein [Candidatus Eisenbacteria bacterium]|nr:AsmA family protein [Candidatus Eisenbacteria bacterium]
MTRRSRSILIVLSLLAVALLLLALIVPALLPQQAFRALVVRELERRLHQPVTVESARLSILPAGVTLSGLEIAAAPNKPIRHARLERVSLRARLLPLLQRRLEIVKVELDRPRIEILSAPAAPSETAPGMEGVGQAARGAAPPMEIDVHDVRIRDGSLRVLAADGSPFLEIGGLSERMSLRASRAGALTIEGRTSAESLAVRMGGSTLGRGLAVRLDARLLHDPAADVLTIEEAKLLLGELPASVTGRVTGIRAKAPFAEVSVEGGPARVSDIQALLPAAFLSAVDRVESEGMLSIAGDVRGPLGSTTARDALASAAGALTSTPAAQPLDFRLDLTLEQGRLRHPKLATPIEDLGFHLAADPDTLELRDFRARAGTSRIEARATAANYRARPRLRVAVDADVDLADVTALQAKSDSLALTGRASAQLLLTGTGASAAHLAPAGTIRVRNAAVKGAAVKLPWSDLNGEIVLSPSVATVRSLTGRVGSSDIALGGELRGYSALLDPRSHDAVGVALDLRSNRFQLDEWLTPDGKFDPAPLRRLDGTVALQAGEVLLQRLRIENARGRVHLRRGRVEIESFQAQAFGGTIGSRGTVDLTGDAPRFDAVVDLSGVQAKSVLEYSSGFNRFAQLAQFLQANMNANAVITGELDPALQLNPATLVSTGQLEIANGSLSGHPLQLALSQALRAPALANVRINDWLQPFRIEAGRLQIDGLQIDAGGVRLTGEGWLALDGKTQMSLNARLPAELSGEIRGMVPSELAGFLLPEQDGRVLVPLAVTGEMPKPKVTIDTAALREGLAHRTEERLAQERQKLADQVHERSGELLKRVLDGSTSPTPRDTAASPFDTTASAQPNAPASGEGASVPADSARVEREPSEIQKEVEGALRDLLRKRR